MEKLLLIVFIPIVCLVGHVLMHSEYWMHLCTIYWKGPFRSGLCLHIILLRHVMLLPSNPLTACSTYEYLSLYTTTYYYVNALAHSLISTTVKAPHPFSAILCTCRQHSATHIRTRWQVLLN